VSVAPVAALHALGSEWSVSPLGGLGTTPVAVPGAAGGAGGSSSGGSFAGALGDALQALQNTQATADTAATQLATGKLADPTSAIAAVENAQLAMQLASQVTNKAVGAVQTIFQMQV
jgi:flagellar hook-basal body complex protein FliE